MSVRLLQRWTVDAVILDLDGTLVDTVGDFVLALNGMLDALGPPWRGRRVQPAQVACIVGQGTEHLLHSVLTQMQPAIGAMNSVAWQALWRRAYPYYLRRYTAINGDAARCYPGVQAGVRGLRQLGLPLACVSNKPLVLAEGLLRRKRLRSSLSLVLGGDSLPRKKPDPMPLQHACSVLGVKPSRCLVVGDSRNDAQAARAAGCPVALLPYGYNHGEPVRAVDADAYLQRLTDLLPR